MRAELADVEEGVAAAVSVPARDSRTCRSRTNSMCGFAAIRTIRATRRRARFLAILSPGEPQAISTRAAAGWNWPRRSPIRRIR